MSDSIAVLAEGNKWSQRWECSSQEKKTTSEKVRHTFTVVVCEVRDGVLLTEYQKMKMMSVMLAMSSLVADGYQMHQILTVKEDCRGLLPLEVLSHPHTLTPSHTVQWFSCSMPSVNTHERRRRK